jgi:hypothetical protein
LVTYITPDDWALNHGIAPGDARGRQPPLQPMPGNQAPLPPMRGYFGPRPYPVQRRRVSPWGVTDSIWGMHGLGGDPIQDILDRLKKDMRKLIMEQAAMSTAISIGLAIIPVVGWAASAIYSVVQAIVGSGYKREMEEVMADTQVKADQIVAEYQQKVQTAQNDAFVQEQDASVQMALTCEELPATITGKTDAPQAVVPTTTKALNGLGTLGFSWEHVFNPIWQISEATNAIRQVIVQIAPPAVARVLERADAELQRESKQVEEGIRVLSGKAAVEKAEAARTEILAHVRSMMEEQYQASIKNMATPEFRYNLRITIAKNLRADPNFAALVNARCQALTANQAQVASGNAISTTGQPLPGYTLPPTAVPQPLTAVPLIAGAAVVAFALFKGHG